MVFPIQLPADAPFTVKQRTWLNDFLSKALSQANQPATPADPLIPVTVLYGSQTGTAEGLAKKLFKTLKKGNFETELHDMSAYDRSRLPTERNLLVIVSTYGDGGGEPPDSAAEMHAWLRSDAAPRLEGVSFSVLALGDSSYPDFCKCGADFEDRLATLGETRLSPKIDADIDVDELFTKWSENILATLSPTSASIPASENPVIEQVGCELPLTSRVLGPLFAEFLRGVQPETRR